jgi:hypothetical protein
MSTDIAKETMSASGYAAIYYVAEDDRKLIIEIRLGGGHFTK